MGYINITGADLKQVAKVAYDLSSPVGLGFLHFKPEPLSDEDASSLVTDRHVPLNMDYVHGRCCKFHVYNRKGNLYINDRWYDHSEQDLQELLKRIGMENAPHLEELPE